MPKPILFLRANGGKNIGLGHISRCVAMAEILENEFQCIFLVNLTKEMTAHIIPDRFSITTLSASNLQEELQSLATIINKDSIVVLDGYDFDINYQLQIRSLAKKLVIIDDLADKHFSADAIINHGNIAVLPEYSIEPGTTVFSGLDYLILRKNFFGKKVNDAVRDNYGHVFICMGGADPFNITNKLLSSLIDLKAINSISVVVGGLFEYDEELNVNVEAVKSSGKHINVYRNLSADQMYDTICTADAAITTASTMGLEVASLGKPLACGYVINNQAAIYSALVQSGCGFPLGDLRNDSGDILKDRINTFMVPAKLQQIQFNQKHRFDGRSAERINSLFKSLAA